MTDDDGDSDTTSRDVTVTEAPPAEFADTTSPLVTIASPRFGQTFTKGATVSLKIEATDNVGVRRVEIFVDGKHLVTILGDGPYDHTFRLSESDLGTVRIEAKAHDENGNTATGQTRISVEG